MSTTTNIDQTNAMLRELRTLRATNRAQSDTIGLLKQQYDDLAGDYDKLMSDSQRMLHEAFVARDKAERTASEVSTILHGAAANIMEGLRSIKGDETPPQQGTVAPLHTPGNHPALVRAIDGGQHGRPLQPE